jgi:hypothetical protein
MSDATPRSAGGDVEKETLEKQAQQTLGEARTVVPGVQALFGFQLIVAFHPRFTSLQGALKVVHLAALVLVAASMALIMAPAAYHRLVERGQVSQHFVDLASRLVAGAMIPLMFAISLDVLLVSHVVLDNAAMAIGIATLVWSFFAMLWVIYPLAKRSERRPR